MFALSPLNQVGSRLLNILSAEEYNRIRPCLEYVTFSSGEVVYEAGGEIEYVYFPTTSIIFWLCIVESGATIEVGMVDNRGGLGVSQVLGDGIAPYRAIVQIAGGALRLEANNLRYEFERGGGVRHLLLRYTQAHIRQISQTAVCHRLHTVEQQLCRLLLLSHDRIGSKGELFMTQELIANLLGVSRESITYAARHLQDEGLISYVRGHIKILDHRGLEKKGCECYQVIESEFERLLIQQRVRRFDRGYLTCHSIGRGNGST